MHGDDALGLNSSPMPGRGSGLLRRPLVALSIVFMIGAYTGLQGFIPWSVAAWSSGLLFLFSLLFRRPSWSLFSLYTGLLLTGHLYGSLGRGDAAPAAIGHQVTQSRSYIGLDGVIDDDPVFNTPLNPKQEGHCVLQFRLCGLRQRTPWQNACGNVRVYVRDAVPGLFEFGQRWTMDGLMIRSSRRAAQDGFSLYTDMDHMRRLSGGSRWNLSAVCFRARRGCADLLSRGVGEAASATLLIKALLLGYRSDLPDALRDLFASTGTFHVFAISGLHVGIMAVMLIGLLKVAGLSRDRWFFPLFPLLVLYTLGTGGRASAVRACVMALIFWAAPVAGRRPESMSALAMAALAILVFDASQLIQPGFVMSFVVVAGLVLMYPCISSRWHRWIQPDDLCLQPEAGVRRALRSVCRYIGDLLCVSLAAWLASAPLTAYYFNLISPVSLLGNMVVVPGTFLVVFTGCLSLLSGLIYPPLAGIFNFANQVFIDLLLYVVRGMQRIPGGHCFVQAPAGWIMAAWYAGLAVLFFGTRFLRRLLLVAVISILFFFGWRWICDDSLTVDVLDTGQGYSALVNLPGERDDMLLDAGCSTYAAPVIRHLRRCGVDRLGVLLLSYPGRDVLSGAEQVLKTIPVRELWCVSPDGFSAGLRGNPDAEEYKQLIEQARRRGIAVRFLAGGEGGFLRGLQWEVLWPESNRVCSAAQDASIVMRVARDGCGILFMNGARQRVEGKLVRSGISLTTPVLVAGAHGAAGTCSEPFLSRADPDWAILSVGPYNMFGDPDDHVLERLNDRGIRLWRTDQQGGVRLRWTCVREGYYAMEPLDDD